MENYEFNVILFGSLDFENFEGIEEKCNNILSRKLKEHGPEKIRIIYGGSKDFNNAVEKYIKSTGINKIKISANWDKYNKRAGYLRNKKMAELGNACIIFGQDNTTKSLEKICRNEKLLIRKVNEV